MPTQIYVDPAATDANVILVGGTCYSRVRASTQPATVFSDQIDGEFDDCPTCGAVGCTSCYTWTDEGTATLPDVTTPVPGNPCGSPGTAIATFGTMPAGCYRVRWATGDGAWFDGGGDWVNNVVVAYNNGGACLDAFGSGADQPTEVAALANPPQTSAKFVHTGGSIGICIAPGNVGSTARNGTIAGNPVITLQLCNT